MFHDLPGILHLPVQWINVPQNHRHRHHTFQFLAPGTIRRANVLRTFSGDRLDFFIGPLDLAAGILHGFCSQLHMLLAVISDQMAILLHLAHQFLVTVQVLADQEKCGLNASFPESV